MKRISILVGAVFAGAAVSFSARAEVRGWLDWRGPNQNGFSAEKNLPDKIAAKDALWTADFPGASTPVIANGKLYIMGFLGSGPELREGVAAFDAETGKNLWQHLEKPHDVELAVGDD